MSKWEGLTDRIEKRIRAIPANNPAFITAAPATLGRLLDGDLIRKIASEAAIEAAMTNLEDGIALPPRHESKGEQREDT